MPDSEKVVVEPFPVEVSRLVTASICSERANPSLSSIASSPEEMSGVDDAPPM